MDTLKAIWINPDLKTLTVIHGSETERADMHSIPVKTRDHN
jgi:hypothetical protein